MQHTLAAGLAALAALSIPSAAVAEQWCPGEPWSLTWGANVNFDVCHETPLADNTDLDHEGPMDWGATPATGDGNHMDLSGVSTGNARTNGGNQQGGGANTNANGTTIGSIGGNQTNTNSTNSTPGPKTTQKRK